MTQSDDTFKHYTLDASHVVDLRSYNDQIIPDYSSVSVLTLKALGTADGGFVTKDGFNTQSLNIWVAGENPGVWREEVLGSDHIKIPTEVTSYGNYRVISNFAKLNSGIPLRLVYDLKTKSGFIIVDNNLPTNFNKLNTNPTIPSDLLGEGDFYVYFKVSGAYNAITYLGHSPGKAIITNDVGYKDENYLVDISGWNQNTRTRNGIIINNPLVNSANDKFSFSVPPANNYAAVLKVTRPKQAIVNKC